MSLLKHRKKDIEFRSSLHDKAKKQETDAEAMLDKLRRKETKIKQLDRDLFSM